MPQFFIHRPVFAWVIALFIVLAGVIAIPKLPISRYPSVAPVSVTLYATYPGATPQTLNDAVVSLIERELSGVKNLLYFESSVDASGSAQITATFKPGRKSAPCTICAVDWRTVSPSGSTRPPARTSPSFVRCTPHARRPSERSSRSASGGRPVPRPGDSLTAASPGPTISTSIVGLVERPIMQKPLR